ncbi:HvfC/BufC family peptide modification chaperone, partial [Sandarakinorhabdus rubra]|uniref:HvfC/BufC family peptide modification chaperone n=1 Tax=Sandarakinorhabdus rubra TaxID=2672568 RepID=UPI0013D965C8
MRPDRPAVAAPTPARFEAWVAGLLRGEAVPVAPALRRAMAVHRNNALAAAMAALADNFPVLRAMLGQDAFAALAQRHALAEPPADPRLCLYGAGLPATIAAAAELATFPYLADLAQLEWLVVKALFAADPPAGARRISAGRSWPPAPATGWLQSDWPVAS